MIFKLSGALTFLRWTKGEMTGPQRKIKDLTLYTLMINVFIHFMLRLREVSSFIHSCWSTEGISHLKPYIIFHHVGPVVFFFFLLFPCPLNWAEVVWGLLAFDGWCHHRPDIVGKKSGLLGEIMLTCNHISRLPTIIFRNRCCHAYWRISHDNCSWSYFVLCVNSLRLSFSRRQTFDWIILVTAENNHPFFHFTALLIHEPLWFPVWKAAVEIFPKPIF